MIQQMNVDHVILTVNYKSIVVIVNSKRGLKGNCFVNSASRPVFALQITRDKHAHF